MCRTVMPVLSVTLVYLVLLFTTETEGSCYQFGHACFGAHGKRSQTKPLPLPYLNAEALRYPSANQEGSGIDKLVAPSKSWPPNVSGTSGRSASKRMGPLNKGMYPYAYDESDVDTNEEVDPVMDAFYTKWMNQMRQEMADKLRSTFINKEIEREQNLY